MSRPTAIILLLAWFLLSIMIGTVHAAGCTPDLDTGICMTTDKTSYHPGEAVTVTVEVSVPPDTPSVIASIAVFPVPSSCGLSCAIAWGSATLYPVAAGVWSGTVAIRLPDSAKAGNYEVEVFGPAWAPYAGAEITITSQTPVPETPSALGILLPAFLAEIYVLKRKKRMDRSPHNSQDNAIENRIFQKRRWDSNPSAGTHNRTS